MLTSFLFYKGQYTLLISMYLQKLMNIHHCIFKILGKNQSVTDGQMDVKTVCGGGGGGV